jgi:hypothetical protein
MLRARPEAGDHQRDQKNDEAAGKSGNHEADAGQRSSGREDHPVAQALREPRRGELKGCHRSRVAGLEHTHGCIIQAEGCLPDGEEDIEKIGQSIMDDMGAARDRDSARAIVGCRFAAFQFGDFCHRRSPSSSVTGSASF